MTLSRPLRFFALGCALLASASLVQAAQKIGVLLKGRSAFWQSMEKGVLEAGARHGIEVVVKSPLNEADVAVQVQLLKAMTAQGFSALVIAPGNKDALVAPIAAATAQGIKVVIVESPLADSSAPFVWTDHKAAGEAAGQLISTLIGEKDEVSFLNHSQTNTACVAREKGALAALRTSRPGQAIHADIYAFAEAGTETEKARLLMTQYPATKAVLASSTPGTTTMLNVLREKNLAGSVKLVGFGFNLNPEIAAALTKGEMHGWIAWQPRALGTRAVEAAAALLKGEAVPTVVNTDFIVVTAQNLQEPAVQALLAQ
jgi:ribose transport system substrate-binding protein